MKHTLQSLILIAYLSIVAFPLHAETTYQWRSVGDVTSEWQEGNFANLGFTRDSLEYLINLDKSSYLHEDLYITFSPTYLDEVYVQFINRQNHSKLVSIGDKYGLYNFEKYEESGLWSLPIPDDTVAIKILAKSTSNLRVSAQVLSASENKRQIIKANTIRAFIIATIIASGLISLALWVTFKRHVFLFFSMYQASWFILLAGIDGVALHILNANWHMYRDAIVSYGVIFALISGSLCHAVILKSLFRLTWLPIVLQISGAIGVALLGLLFWGYDFEALRLNSLLISLIPLVIFIGAFVEKPKTTDHRIKWQRTRLLYGGLMLSVMATGISGLGTGSLFAITYIHAIFTTIILSYIILNALGHQRDLSAQQILNDALTDANSRYFAAQLKDNKALLSMLAHEIKTPITTIKLLIHKATNEQAISKQLNEIQGVLDQVSNINYYNDKLTQTTSRDAVILSEAIEQGWERSGENKNHIVMNMRLNETVVNMNRSELSIILRNLFTNVKKYATPDTTFRVFSVSRESYTDLIFSNKVSNFNEQEMDRVFEKYWRSKDAHRNRGTGIGLWITKEICEKYNFPINACIHRHRFTMTISIPNREIRYV